MGSRPPDESFRTEQLSGGQGSWDGAHGFFVVELRLQLFVVFLASQATSIKKYPVALNQSLLVLGYENHVTAWGYRS
jgi:hypothetical protein